MSWWLRQESNVALTCTVLSTLTWLTRTLPLKDCPETLQLSNWTHESCWRAREAGRASVGRGKLSRLRWSLSEVHCWLCSWAKEGLLPSVAAMAEGSAMNSRTAVRASPMASAKTTRFLLGLPPASLRKQLRGSEGAGEEGAGEEGRGEDE